MFLETDLTDLPASVRSRMHQLLTEENAMAAVQAQIRQRQIHEFYRQNQPRAIDGIGGLETAIDPYWINYWRWKLGAAVVGQDQEFRAWLKKKHAVFRVKSGGTRLQVGFAGSGKRFVKRYAEPSKRPNTPFVPKRLNLQLSNGLS